MAISNRTLSEISRELCHHRKRAKKMASTAAYHLRDNHRYSITNFNLVIKYSFAQADEILLKINALKNITYTSRNFFTSAYVAVMWHIPPPNSSLSFEVSAIFCPLKIEYISSAELMRSVQSRIIYSIVYGRRLSGVWRFSCISNCV